jgi:hypothetical protein
MGFVIRAGEYHPKVIGTPTLIAFQHATLIEAIEGLARGWSFCIDSTACGTFVLAGSPDRFLDLMDADRRATFSTTTTFPFWMFDFS